MFPFSNMNSQTMSKFEENVAKVLSFSEKYSIEAIQDLIYEMGFSRREVLFSHIFPSALAQPRSQYPQKYFGILSKEVARKELDKSKL